MAGVGVVTREQYWLLDVLYWRMMAGVGVVTREQYELVVCVV